MKDIVLGLEGGLQRGQDATGARVMLICDIDRAYGGRAGLELVERVAELHRHGGAQEVIGVGMDSTERGIDAAANAERRRRM